MSLEKQTENHYKTNKIGYTRIYKETQKYLNTLRGETTQNMSCTFY